MGDRVRQCPKCGNYYDDELQQSTCPHAETPERHQEVPPRIIQRMLEQDA